MYLNIKMAHEHRKSKNDLASFLLIKHAVLESKNHGNVWGLRIKAIRDP